VPTAVVSFKSEHANATVRDLKPTARIEELFSSERRPGSQCPLRPGPAEVSPVGVLAFFADGIPIGERHVAEVGAKLPYGVFQLNWHAFVHGVGCIQIAASVSTPGSTTDVAATGKSHQLRGGAFQRGEGALVTPP
jgi:hypothetical protein